MYKIHSVKWVLHPSFKGEWMLNKVYDLPGVNNYFKNRDETSGQECPPKFISGKKYMALYMMTKQGWRQGFRNT